MEETTNPTIIPLILRLSAASKAYRFSFYMEDEKHNIYNKDHTTPYYAFVVLTRSDPCKVVYQEFTIPPNYSVPTKVLDLLDSKHLLVFGFCGSLNYVPQGELYSTLITHGGGSKLRALETWCTHFASGAWAYYCYALVSAPGTGLMGAESLMADKLDLPMTVELMRGMGGLYSPHQLT